MNQLEDVRRLGLGEAIPISALQGEGMADVAVLIEQMKQQKYGMAGARDAEDLVWTKETAQNGDDDEEAKPLQLAVLGRQNVGKSTLVNALVQKERVLTGPVPGLTRDAISINYTWEDNPVQLVCRRLRACRVILQYLIFSVRLNTGGHSRNSKTNEAVG